jgi:hypothetical protein
VLFSFDTSFTSVKILKEILNKAFIRKNSRSTHKKNASIIAGVFIAI